MKTKIKHGFTLMEIIVSIAIIGIIVTLFVPAITSAYSDIQRSGTSTKSATIAEGVLENAFRDVREVLSTNSPPTTQQQVDVDNSTYFYEPNEIYNITGDSNSKSSSISVATIQSMENNYLGNGISWLNSGAYIFGISTNDTSANSEPVAFLDVDHNNAYNAGDIPVTIDDLNCINANPFQPYYLPNNPTHLAGTLIINSDVIIDTSKNPTNQDIHWILDDGVVFKNGCHLKSSGNIKIYTGASNNTSNGDRNPISGDIVITNSHFDADGFILLDANFSSQTYNKINYGSIYITSSTFNQENTNTLNSGDSTPLTLNAYKNIIVKGIPGYGCSFISKAKIVPAANANLGIVFNVSNYADIDGNIIGGNIFIDEKGGTSNTTTFYNANARDVITGSPQILNANSYAECITGGSDLPSNHFNTAYGRDVSKNIVLDTSANGTHYLFK